MSKRGADEYITKENGSTPNSALEAQKVKMATAAQLAKRKMAVPKSRAGRSGQSPMPGAGPSNPFTSTNSFGAPQNNQQAGFPSTGGITFGASQSFPPGDTANGGFTFSAPGQSSSFTFGQTSSNNPFATLNGASSNQPATSPDTNDITMESPQKKPAFGANLFGSNTNDNTTSSTSFAFGQSTNQQSSSLPSFSFGQSQGFGSGPTTSLFGQSTSKVPELTATTTTFEQPAQSPVNTSPTPPPFGRASTPSEQAAPSSGFTFGQSTAAPTSASATAFSFTPSTTSAPSAKPTFSFGQPSTQLSSSSTLFGESKQSSLPAFSQSTTTSQPEPSASLFGNVSAAPSNGIFGGLSGSKDAHPTPQSGTTSTAETPKPPVFGRSTSNSSLDQPKSPSAAQEQSKSNPFAGLFGQNTPNMSASTTLSPSDTSKPTFSFSAPAQPSGLFSSAKPVNDANDLKAPETTVQKPLFSFGTPAAQPSSGLFSAPKPVPEASTGFSNPFAGLSSKTQDQNEIKTQKPLFGFSQESQKQTDASLQPSAALGQAASDSIKPNSSTSGSNRFGGFGKSQNSSFISTPTPSFNEKDSQTQKSQSPLASGSSIGPTSNNTTKPTTSVFTATAAAAAMIAGSSTSLPSSNGQVENAEHSKRTINTYPPTRIPPYLNGDDYKAYDSNYRLHSLNREFQKRIASLDPSRDDFENIIRNYVAARESIGESMGLYTRNVAGMKRKADEEDDRSAAQTNSSKKSKPADTSQSKQLFGAGPTPSSIFQPVPSSQPLNNSAGTPLSKAASPAKQTTSFLFNSMIPDNKSSSPAPVSSNPFAGLSKTNAAGPNEHTSTPVFSFGNTNAAAPVGSTTPTKSPPKRPAFEVPKFSAPVGGANFLDMFKKQSDESAAKFAKDAKAKRKAEEFDSDEDDEEEWERKYEEEEKAKKAQLGAIAQKGFTPSLVNGASTSTKPLFGFGQSTDTSSTLTKAASGSIFGNQISGKTSDKPINISDNDASEDDEEEGASGDSQTDENEGADDDDDEDAGDDEDDLPEDDVQAEDENDEDEDLETVMANSRNKGKSLFDRVTSNPTLQKGSSPALGTTTTAHKDAAKKPNVFGSLFGKGTPEAPSFSPLTPTGSKEPYVPSKTFNFTPTPPITSPTPVAGASIFAGGMIKDGPISGEGLFGSRPSTPSNVEKPKSNFFGGFGTPSTNSGVDHTWKKGSEIKFGTSTNEAPALSITEPSPRREDFKPFANLFGAKQSSTIDPSTQPNFGFGFGQTPVPGYLAAASHLAGGSGTNSGISSRATSPGTTDNESVATNEEDYSNDAQVSLLESRPGEENEDALFETRARALRWYKEDEIQGTKFNKGWNAVGLGNVRLLKHKETGKARLVMRADPGANIILNTNLLPDVSYDYAAAGSTGTVKFTVFTTGGGQGWTLKTKTQQQAQEMAKLMEENKKPNN